MHTKKFILIFFSHLPDPLCRLVFAEQVGQYFSLLWILQLANEGQVEKGRNSCCELQSAQHFLLFQVDIEDHVSWAFNTEKVETVRLLFVRKSHEAAQLLMPYMR